MSTAPLALGLAAGALLLAGPRTGSARVRAMSAPATSRAPDEAAVRFRWVLVGSGAAAALVWALVGGTGGLVAGITVGAGLVVAVRRLTGAARAGRTDAGDLAAAWDLLAVCLQVGLAVPVAVQAAAHRLPGSAGTALRRTAGLLALGAGAEQAWGATEPVPELAAFGRAASRSAATGAALRRTAEAESLRLRAELADQAEARAQRAAVQITAPLGLCFLPAFLVLGIAPVVIGLAGEAFAPVVTTTGAVQDAPASAHAVQMFAPHAPLSTDVRSARPPQRRTVMTSTPSTTRSTIADTVGRRLAALIRDDDGMSTVEYAIGTVAAAAFAAVLYAVVSGDSIVTALTGIVQRALSTTF